jgi:hypothetical protein
MVKISNALRIIVDVYAAKPNSGEPMKPKHRRLMPTSESVTGSGIVVVIVWRTSDSKETSAAKLVIPLYVAVFVSAYTG